MFESCSFDVDGQFNSPPLEVLVQENFASPSACSTKCYKLPTLFKGRMRVCDE